MLVKRNNCLTAKVLSPLTVMKMYGNSPEDPYLQKYVRKRSTFLNIDHENPVPPPVFAPEFVDESCPCVNMWEMRLTDYHTTTFHTMVASTS